MKKMQIHMTRMELKEMIDSVDDDASGTIDFQEFLVLMQIRVGKGGPDADVRYAFLQFDKNNTGFIDKESLKRTMSEFDHPLTNEEVDAVFKEVDLDEDGLITFREFQQLLVRCLHSFVSSCSGCFVANVFVFRCSPG